MSDQTDNTGKVEALSLERFRRIVDAYGGRPHHWPANERQGAISLLADCTEARDLRTAALNLDEALDRATVAPVTSELTARILASLPPPPAAPLARRRPVVRYLAFAAPLAAAAALVLWMTLPAQLPAPLQVATEDLGSYDVPTDVLLDSPSFDISGTLPVLGCGESGLGCIDDVLADETQSQIIQLGRSIV